MSHPDPLVLTIPGDAADLAPNQRMGWKKERRLEAQWHWRAWMAWMDAGSPRFEGRVRISFTIRRGRALDEDNAAGSRALKAIVDGLKDQRKVIYGHGFYEARMILDDDPAHVERGEARQEIGSEWRGCPQVIVTVEAVE